jgi:hypothetical protein
MNQQQTESDLRYVREVVQRAEDPRSPPSIYYFWAIVTLVGFSIVDYKPEYAGRFWMIAGPGGWLVTALLARSWSRKNGEMNFKLGARYGAHWAGLLGGIFLLLLGAVKGGWEMETAGQFILLILAMSYFFAGIHLDRPLIWISLIMAIGYVVLFYVSGPIWTIMGVAVALGLAMTPWLESRSNASNN